MRLLLDESLSRRLGKPLSEVGHDVVHVAGLGLLAQPDTVIMDAAREDDRVLVAADTDFGTLLALSGAGRPSVLLLRGRGRTRADRATLITEALARVQKELAEGALVVLDGDRLRIRVLPIEPSRRSP